MDIAPCQNLVRRIVLFKLPWESRGGLPPLLMISFIRNLSLHFQMYSLLAITEVYNPDLNYHIPHYCCSFHTTVMLLR